MDNDITQNMPQEELVKKEAALAAEVERLLPDFVNSCREKADVVIIHQDSFAAYQDHEYALLGKAIKFAGLHGKGSPHHREKQGNAQGIE
jgi:hypothetical protein